MPLGYIDTSFLLSILFEDDNYETTVTIWNQLETLYSSQLLDNISRKNIDSEIILEIKNIDKLKRFKSLDSIHLATANIVNKLLHKELLLCTYDKNMIRIGKEMRMKTIQP